MLSLRLNQILFLINYLKLHQIFLTYKKGEIMPADYLSRLPSTKQDHLAEITTCFDPFQPELLDLQKNDPDLQKMNHFRLKYRNNL